jgi:type II secretory pathway pseudopilin PulG
VKSGRLSSPREAGYAVLLAIFLVATMLLLAAAAAPNILTQGRRLREQEAIWRGNQYVRAIRLYYQKNGKYPASLEDLSKANAVGVHFLRKAYTEPMNSADGNWRLIYVTPTGQLVGSVHFHNLQEMAVSAAFAGQLPGGAAGFASQVFGQPNLTPPGGAQSSIGAQSAQQNGLSSTQQFGASQTGPTGQNSQNSLASTAQPAPLEAVDSPVFGGSVIGVASKVKQSSITVYQGGKTYFEWEFIWNPLLNANGGAPGQQIVVPGLNGPTQPGAVPNPGASGLINAPGTMPIAPQPGPFAPGGQPQPAPGPQN